MKKLMFLFILLFSVFHAKAETLTLLNLSGEQAFVSYEYKFYLQAGNTVTIKRADPNDIIIITKQLNYNFFPDKGSRLITIGTSQVFDEEYATPTDAFWMGIQVAGFFSSLLILVRIVRLIRLSPVEI